MTLLFALVLFATPAAAPSPQARAEQVARELPHVQHARQVVLREIAAIQDPALRKSVEAQLASVPFWSAPGGPCPGGHHAYPGGLAVHTAANALHAVALGRIYRELYGVAPRQDFLRAAALWHDEAKATTLAWKEGGDCGQEPQLAGTAAHHVQGIAAAISRGLPHELVVIIAAAHAPPTKENLDKLCGWLRAASTLATGKPDAVACPSAAHPAPLEAFINNSSDSDYALTGAASSLAVGAGSGWERFETLRDASELQRLTVSK